jgi:hypothetical protein
MSKRKENSQRERRISMEIVVDAYGAWEQAMGWYYYLEETLHFPFRARCIKKRSISPLLSTEKVEVIGMPPEVECEKEMFVTVKWNGRVVAVPLSQLECCSKDKKTKEAVADWHYWVERGYQFG